MVMQVKEKDSRIIWSLTEAEQAAFQRLILGHGNLKKAADKVNLNRLSISRIALTGRGYKPNISKIRKKLLANVVNEAASA